MFPELTLHMNIYILSCPIFFWHLSFLPCYLRNTCVFFCSILNLKHSERERNNLTFFLGQASWNQLSFSIIWKFPYWHQNFHIISLCRHLSLHFLSSSISASDETWFFIQLYSPFYSTFFNYSYWSHCCGFGIIFFFHCKCIMFKLCLRWICCVGLAYKLNGHLKYHFFESIYSSS